MAYSYRAWANGGTAGSGGAYTINKPSGTAENDLLVAVLYLEADTNTWQTPSGWTAGPTQVNTGAFSVAVFWKVAGASEPASWTFTPNSSNWRSGGCAAWSGATGSGTSRVDISGGAQGDAEAELYQKAPTVTTTVTGDLVVFAYANFDGTNPSALTGFASNLAGANGSATIGYAVKSPEGATGTTGPNGGVGTTTWAALHVAFLLDTGGGGATATPSDSVTLSETVTVTGAIAPAARTDTVTLSENVAVLGAYALTGLSDQTTASDAVVDASTQEVGGATGAPLAVVLIEQQL